jgi:uncharacterized protein (TIGR03437 family)
MSKSFQGQLSEGKMTAQRSFPWPCLHQAGPVALFVLAACFALAQPPPAYTISTYAGGALPSVVPAVGINTSIGKPASVTVDANGNAYFTALNYVFKLDQTGMVTRIAGNGIAGFSGDGGLALNAQFNGANGVAADAGGNIYVADGGNSRVRKISPDGKISTFAGNGVAEHAGNGVPAASTSLAYPAGVAVDHGGNLYIADMYANSVHKVSPTGIITTIAGGSSAGYGGDGGLAINALFYLPAAVVVDSGGNLYIADQRNNRVRKITPAGTISTVAGNGTLGYSGDGGPATSAHISFPTGLAVDSAGNLYLTDTNCIREVSPAGIISTVAGVVTGAGFPPQFGYSGDGGPANKAEINEPSGVAVDSLGDVYIADTFNARIREISPAGIINTVAGTGELNYSGDGGLATSARLSPYGLSTDASGNLYVAEQANNRVRKISPGGIVTGAAGNGVQGYSGDGGPAVSAELNNPYGVAVDTAGNLYIADRGNNRVRMISSAGLITTIAGNGTLGYSGDDAAATSARLFGTSSVAVDPSGAVYIADSFNSRIRRVSKTGIITTVAGNGVTGYSGDGGPATSASLSEPFGVILDGSGNLYIADTYNNRIRKVSSTGIISTIAGTGIAGFSGDGGPAVSAMIYDPFAIAIDGSGNLFIADSENNRIREVSPEGIISTIAGNGKTGYAGDAGPAASAEIGAPFGLAVDNSGNIYMADVINNVIRRLQVTVTQSPSTIGVSAVANAASNLLGLVAPGEIVTLYGFGLGPARLVQAQADSGTGRMGSQLAGTTVSFNGFSAPILYTSASQVAAIVPFEVSGNIAQVTVTFQAQESVPLSIGLGASAPGLFTRDSTGTGQAAVVNQDGSINGPDHPAPPESFVSLFATGVGLTAPAGSDGAPSGVPLPQPILPIGVLIQGETITPQYAGGAPGEVQGLIQINLQLPSDVPPGTAVPVVINAGGTFSQSGVTVFVGQN